MRVMIILVSVAIPVLVTILFIQPKGDSETPAWISVLPHLNAVVNSLTSLILILGYVMIRNKKVHFHKTAMLTALSLGIVFLISYVVYHANAPSQMFGDTNDDGVLDEIEKLNAGSVRLLYLGLLLSHVLLAIATVPLVLIALYFASFSRFTSHKKVVKFAYPIWLYVSVSGVLVYVLISPYY